jgi:hypothetical protein
VCDSPNQAAHNDTFDPKLGASSLTWHFTGLRVNLIYYLLDQYGSKLNLLDNATPRKTKLISFIEHWEVEHMDKHNLLMMCRIWGSHGGEYEDDCLLSCSTM